MSEEIQNDMNQIYDKFYSMLLRIYNDNDNTIDSEKRIKIPCVLAFLSIKLNDMNKVEEIVNKFGISAFTDMIGPWGYHILIQIGILPILSRSESPTNVQDINTEISINSTI
tara:strand:- start:184 stop:519 length:336 start_codon:yes stop_codon:yes gene_type:complete